MVGEPNIISGRLMFLGAYLGLFSFSNLSGLLMEGVIFKECTVYKVLSFTIRLKLILSDELRRNISQKTQNFVYEFVSTSIVVKGNAGPLLRALVNTDAAAAENR